MLNLYSDTQSNNIKNNLNELIKSAAKKKLSILEPTLDEVNSVMNVIKSYIKKKKRIIYGGYAMNQLLIAKNKKDAIYDDEVDTPDIEFYTPDPINDLIEICNELEDKKFKFVTGKNAMHSETYSIFVNFENYCDMSYVPKIIYNNMETIKINNTLMIHPKYIMIDMFRQFTDPITSHWRWDKQFTRFSLLQKHYPFKENNSKIQLKIDINHKAAIQETLDKFIIKKETLILFNYFAYNYYINVSKIKDSNIKEVDIPYLDIISINYVEDTVELFKFLKKLYKEDITIEEYYPFFQFSGYNTKILYKGKEFINIYHYNYKCVPFKKIKSNTSYNGYCVGTFPLVLMMLLILQEKTKIDKNYKTTQNYNIMFSNILKIRNNYLNKNKKTLLDDTPFQEFQVSCKGTTLTQNRLHRLEIEKKRKEGKRISYYYHPSEKRESKNTTFFFKNTSGNLIRNDKNKKILKNLNANSTRMRSKESNITDKTIVKLL